MSLFRPVGMLRSVVRPMMAKQSLSLVRPAAFVQPSSARLFSSQSPLSAVTQQLTEALTSEIEAEKTLEKEQLGGAAAPTMSGFKVQNDEAVVTLTKSHNNEKFVLCGIGSASYREL
uniref:Uncharacterized protein n=1 Tax=Plectus sambesii TaxID=2011161 RepID=A0A914X7H1_9BILA